MGIYVNEVGYYQNSVKHANVTGCKSVTLYKEDGTKINTYVASELKLETLSGEKTGLIDFSDIKKSGKYYFKDNKGRKSATFEISKNPYKALSTAALKMFYFQRCGVELTPEYAGVYTHKICHTSKVKDILNRNKIFECNGGWHDAGDFGRYVTAGAVAVAHLLYAYIYNPKAFDEKINIPESGNGMPDILNECKYELDWMLKMQLDDGGVYHKCTSMKHAPFEMPEEDKLTFYACPVSSLAVADFAAVTALASRVYKAFDKKYSKKLHDAALKSGAWLEKNKGLIFEEFKSCTTGDYGDYSDIDERLWAAAELYRIDNNKSHLSYMASILDMKLDFTGLGWMDVAGLAALCVTTCENVFPPVIYDQFKNSIIDEANRLVNVATTNAFEIAMHPYNFKWGSNMVLLTGTMVLCVANKLTDNKKYRDNIIFQLDYLLGRNAMDTSYVTGFGDHAFKNPHNRPTAMDKIDVPIPGYVSGGPNMNHCDAYSLANIPKNTAPMKCYVDHVESYSTNEITIYWNSPLVFILALMG